MTTFVTKATTDVTITMATNVLDLYTIPTFATASYVYYG